MTEAEAIVVITREIKALSSNFVAADYADAVDAAERDTGFSFPTTTSFNIDWLIKRTKRALFFSLFSENVESFKFKQINLQDKFKNLKEAIIMMDKEFSEALENYSYLFSGVSAVQMFGTKVDAGFASDDLGRDVTYDPDQLVEFTPKSGD
jgi:hypothetical protein